MEWEAWRKEGTSAGGFGKRAWREECVSAEKRCLEALGTGNDAQRSRGVACLLSSTHICAQDGCQITKPPVYQVKRKKGRDQLKVRKPEVGAVRDEKKR